MTRTPEQIREYNRRWREENREAWLHIKRKSRRNQRLRDRGVDPERLIGWLHELSCCDPAHCRCLAYPVYRQTLRVA